MFGKVRLSRNLLRTFSTSSFNAREASKFSNVNWDSSKFAENGFYFANLLGLGRSGSAADGLREMHPLRMEIIKSFIMKHGRSDWRNVDFNGFKPLDGVSVLDVGSGGGLLSRSFLEMGCKVTALDVNEKNLEFLEENLKSEQHLSENLTTFNGLIEDISKKNEKFDIVCCLEVIEHVDNVELFLSNVARSVKKDGILIISTLNQTLTSFALGIVAAEYITGKVPVGTHDWTKFISPETIDQLLSNNGSTNMHVDEVIGMIYNPITRSWNASQSCHDVNYILVATPI